VYGKASAFGADVDQASWDTVEINRLVIVITTNPILKGIPEANK
jgi:hypothetical protein